jgi:hypothetical protein
VVGRHSDAAGRPHNVLPRQSEALRRHILACDIAIHGVLIKGVAGFYDDVIDAF